MKARARARRGQALVEFALVLPILVLLLLGIFEFGRAYNAYEVITDAAREATRRAVVDDTVSVHTIETIAISALSRAGMTADSTMVTITPTGLAGVTAGTPTSVAIAYPFRFLFMGSLIGVSQVTLRSTSTMRHE